MSQGLIWRVSLSLCLIVCTVLNISTVFAEQLQSANYRLEESSIGTSDSIQSSSTNYKTTNAAGSLAVGHASSSSYTIDTGTKTSPDPTLSFAFENTNANFGSFSPAEATVTTASFSVSNYTSYGYAVQITGNPPTYNGHTISAMSSNGPSQIGTEQFGVNMVANTSPTTFGANPDNGQYGFGTAATNYNTANQYRFVSGETIASAPKSSGKTIYTISYLVNVTGVTPAGPYNSDQTIIIIGTY